MAWIESHQELGQHPKTRRLARLLGISLPAAVGHLHYLWWWALDYAEDGDLSGYDAREIAEAAMWDGDPQEFVGALLECGPGDRAGYLERTEDGRLVLHDWDEYAGRLVERRARDRERKRRERAARRGEDVRRTSAGHPQDVRETSVATQPYQYHTNGGSDTDNALGNREEIASADDAPAYQPATTTEAMVDDPSVTPQQMYQRVWGLLPPTIDALLERYMRPAHHADADTPPALDPSALKWAIAEARIHGRRDAAYLRAILDRLVAQGLTTAAAAQQHEDKRRTQVYGRAAAPTGETPPTRPRSTLEGAPNAGAYREIDRATVERYAALIYAAGAADAADKPP